MKNKDKEGLDFEVDKLTNSIENVVTGDNFQTEIAILTKSDLKNVTKRKGWLFNWQEEFKSPIKDVYKLTIIHNPTVIQGVVSLEVKPDHVFMHLVENAPFNKGKDKMYSGVAGNPAVRPCGCFCL